MNAPKHYDFDYEEFIDEVYHAPSDSPQYKPFCRKAEVEQSVQAVFKVLRRNLSEGEYMDLMAYMPISLRLYLNTDYMFEGQSSFY